MTELATLETKIAQIGNFAVRTAAEKALAVAIELGFVEPGSNSVLTAQFLSYINNL
jgi:hypothetical protein